MLCVNRPLDWLLLTFRKAAVFLSFFNQAVEERVFFPYKCTIKLWVSQSGVALLYCVTLNMKALRSSDDSVTVYRSQSGRRNETSS